MGEKAFKPTLKNSLEIARFLGYPEKELKLVHVAGSNGKGSTSSMLASSLTEAGYKVGLFTSPHIKDYTERIRINGEQIPVEFVVQFIRKIKSVSFNFSPSFFEITLGLALDYFKAANCDICIIETGLGGRFDATNIISPILSIITNISLEHTDMLGDTIELIAKEKAGIIKPKTPVALGKMKQEALDVMIDTANKKNCQIFLSNLEEQKEYDLPLLGDYQKENLSTVITSLKVLKGLGFKVNKHQIDLGLQKLTKNTGFAGRLQLISSSPRVIHDVSHNPDGIKASLETIYNSTQGDLHIIYGTSGDKDLLSSIALFPEKARLYFTEFSNPRTAKIEELRSISDQFVFMDKIFFNDPKLALQTAKDCASTRDTILVIGSFFLISDFL
ncbi:MAG: bifunctional folylpolyglutamate synthase/dihydrofolate synthase [Crocinitomicaceae bacterium]|nr:bifunctional folylpolyglutamate synthase/dihydrofolate synthase [Crocinitomicaceae bacterium]